MPKIDIQIDSTIVGILSLDPQDIYAQGGPDFPVLYIRTDFGITPYQQYGQPDGLKPLTCVSMTGEFCSPPERVVARFQHSECVHSSRNDNRMYSNQVTFTIPLDLATINRIEKSRNGKASKGLVVTTSFFTSTALKYIESSKYRLANQLVFLETPQSDRWHWVAVS